MTDEALHHLILTRLDTMDRRKEDDIRRADERHEATMTALRVIQSKQEAFARCHDECSGWRAKHAIAHGLDESKPPSAWVANCTAWAWHHPKRTAVGLLFVFALFNSDLRNWLVEKSTWALSMWLAG